MSLFKLGNYQDLQTYKNSHRYKGQLFINDKMGKNEKAMKF